MVVPSIVISRFHFVYNKLASKIKDPTLFDVVSRNLIFQLFEDRVCVSQLHVAKKASSARLLATIKARYSN